MGSITSQPNLLTNDPVAQETHTNKSKGTQMPKITIAAVALLLIGCSTPEPVAVPEPAPVEAATPAREPENEPFTYGDDARLDSLWDRCANDNLDACDLLYWDSPWDSDYERFALQRQDELDVTMNEQEIADAFGADFFLDIVWADMSTVERGELCVAYSLLGPEVSSQVVAEGTSGLFDADEIRPWLTDKCE
jgi:hypothetical protein